MCGIGLLVTQPDSTDGTSDASNSLRIEHLVKSIARRGPNHSSTYSFVITENATSSTQLQFCASVLHIQGEIMTKQPVVDSDGNVLLWNGQVFGGVEIPRNQSDTLFVSSHLQSYLLNEDKQPITDQQVVAHKITSFLAQVHGPFAMIYFHVASSSVHYARDAFGRRSLLRMLAPMADTSAERSETNIDSRGPVVKGGHILGLCSVRPMCEQKFDWEEVPNEGVFSVSFASSDSHIIREHILTPWSSGRIRLSRMQRSSTLSSNSSGDNSSGDCAKSDLSIGFQESSQKLLNALTSAMNRRVAALHTDTSDSDKSDTINTNSCCEVGVLFSGGIDSVLLTAILHHSLSLRPAAAIELINVSFFDDRASKPMEPSPDRLAAIIAVDELQRLFPSRPFRLVHVDIFSAERERCEPYILSLIYPSDTTMDLNIASAFWFASRGVGYLRTYSVEEVQRALTTEVVSGRPMVRVGAVGAALSVGRTVEIPQVKNDTKSVGEGLPSSSNMAPAATASVDGDDESDSVDIPVSKLSINGSLTNIDSVKDAHLSTQTSIDDVKHNTHKFESRAQKLCRRPNCNGTRKTGCKNNYCVECCRRWMNDDAGQSESRQCPVHKKSVKVPDPSKQTPKKKKPEEQHHEVTNGANETTLFHNIDNIDLSIETAVSNSIVPDGSSAYLCRSKALLIGIGADEQMAGYSRHRTSFNQGGVDALEAELNMDQERLWKRNLGRDDRCITDHGRDGWYPFLDEEVVSLLQSLPLSEIADMSEPAGVGDKKILRLAARSLGLELTSEFVKRAIQFGTRVAKITNEKNFGSRRKGKGQYKIS